MSERCYFLCGIGGSGMNPLAQVLRHLGHSVRGSDRSFDQGDNVRVREALKGLGIELFPQDGSGIDAGVSELVVSSAIEPTIPDVQAALQRQLPIRKRAELLAELFNAGHGLAIAGTSGKSTVTAMVGHILQRCGRQPLVVNGAVMRSVATGNGLGNVLCGDADLPVIEADESDGTISLYRPEHALITNITLDHKPMAELRVLFGDFCAATRGRVVLNADCAESVGLRERCRQPVTFGFGEGADFRATELLLTPAGSTFTLCGEPFRLQLLGRHNVANLVAAVALCEALGVGVAEAAAAIADFAGVERRLQCLGTANGITVIDDFGHNPDKIAASLAALRATGSRLLVMYQPHGFGPTRFLRVGLVAAFAEGLGEEDRLVMPEIYFAGGTAEKTISAGDLIRDIAAAGRHASFVPERSDIRTWFRQHARTGDICVVMGARDNSLTDFARALLADFS